MIATSHKTVFRSQRGFTLIEALIAFVILSVGLLGIVSLQALAKQSQHQAVQRARAVGLTDAMVERIRINPAGIPTYNIGLGTPIDGTRFSSEPTPNCDAATCTPAQLATHDLWAWEQTLIGTAATIGGNPASGMASPRGCIVFNASPGKINTGRLNVIIQWTGLQSSTDAVRVGGSVCGTGAIGSVLDRRQVSSNTYVIDEQEL